MYTERNKTIQILGTTWKIEYVKESDFPEIATNCSGNTNDYAKTIQVVLYDKPSENPLHLVNNPSKTEFNKCVLRHEIVHAYLYECGLGEDSNKSPEAWAMNEEMVDWFARLSPKIFETFRELDLL